MTDFASLDKDARNRLLILALEISDHLKCGKDELAVQMLHSYGNMMRKVGRSEAVSN